MSTAEKVELVASVWEEHGLAPALSAVELPKSTWYYHRQQKVRYEEKYAHLRPILEEIARKHPAYGIPRVTKELHETYEQPVNHKVVRRLLQCWDLALLRDVPRPEAGAAQKAIAAAGKGANRVAQMAHIGLFDVAYTDFTELVYANGRKKAYLMPILAHHCKVVYGWAVGPRANSALALRAWQHAKQTFAAKAIPYQGMIVHHDRDSVYTGYRWIRQLLLEDEVWLSYALNGARDNPEMESFFGRFKGENVSLLLDADDLAELKTVVGGQMRYYNGERRHSSLDYMAPLTYLEEARNDGQL